MNLVNYLQFLEPIQDNVTRFYSTTSEIITVLLVLWCLNFIAGLIQRTYATGRAFGNFYRSYLHRYIGAALNQINSVVSRRRQSSSEGPSIGPQPAR